MIFVSESLTVCICSCDRVLILCAYGKHPKTPWSRKGKLSAKIERMREAKRAASDGSAAPSPSATSLVTAASGNVGEHYF